MRAEKTPLVTVMLPCYNAERTLRRALASLVAQTYGNWECIFVDDGSTDGSRSLVESVCDPRIEALSFPRNRGRGAARQLALSRVRGKYLALLDADDWIYPWKLERQVRLMEEIPSLAALGSAMAIIDERGDLVGVRPQTSRSRPMAVRGPFAPLDALRISFATSLIQAKFAREAGFEEGFQRSEDGDFLRRVLACRYYASLHEATYVYSWCESANLESILEGMRYRELSIVKYRHACPVRSRVRRLQCLTKSALYRLSFWAGIGRRLVQVRCSKPSEADRRDFALARQTVNEICARVFH
ncbi:MAG: glycosyltransferase family 2 protein [Planctomycetota bacterium]